MSNFEDYQDLSGVGYQGGGGEKVAPEEEDFHSIYIAGKTRQNHIGTTEKSGLFQIRGFMYNLEKVHMIITHTKDILAKIETEKAGKERTLCFSFKEGSSPWFGNTNMPNGTKRQCPNTSAERVANDFCKTCKAQILVAGLICNENGSPMLTEEKKPVFGFIRGRATKYMNISNYLNEMFKLDLDPIFTPVTEQSKQFEKTVVNNKRFVTTITKGTMATGFGNDASVFVLSKGSQLPNDVVMKILKLSKDTVSKFNLKFDWSKKKISTTDTYSAPQQAEGIMSMEAAPEKSEQPQQPQQPQTKTFSFDDIEL